MQLAKLSGRRKPDVQMSPLIDVVFLLLIFFLITTTFVTNPGISVDLPKASTQEVPSESNSIIVALTVEGMLVHEGHALSRAELKTVFERALAERPTATVIIQADEEVTHGRVVDIMDLAKTSGFDDLAIATESP